MMHDWIRAAATLLALTLSAAARAATFTEVGDAGQALATAIAVSVANPTEIEGGIGDGSDADLFALSLTAGVAFSATISGSSPTPILDTQLFLFDAAGNGLRFNDDIEAIDFYSSISFTPATSGTYFLAISAVGFNPKDALDGFIYESDPFDPTAQPGPSPAGPLASWGPGSSGLSDSGGYRIGLSGATAAPEPGSALLLAVALLGLRFSRRARARVSLVAAPLLRGLAVGSTVALLAATAQAAPPKVILISLDGAQPDLIQSYLASGVLPQNQGLGLLKNKGAFAQQNVTATPSLTAVSHIAIATGSTAVHNDIPGNTYHAVVQPIGNTTSGFSGPIGGYQISPLGVSPSPTAVPLWVTLRNAGKSVVTATWPGGDGLDITLFGTPGNPVVQPASVRTLNYTVPFGAFGGLGAEGYVRTAADFVNDDGSLAAQLAAAGKTSYSQVKLTSVPVTQFFCVPAPNAAASNPCGTSSATRTLRFTIKAAALDTSNDFTVNYDMLVFYNDDAAGPKIPAGPFSLPSTGPAYAKLGGPSAKFYLEGSGNKVGGAFFTTFMSPDLSLVRFARISFNFIPRNAPVLADVDDVNNNVGFWAPQPDFRIPERLSPGFGPFPDAELEAIYEDLVKTFIAYQARMALRAISRNQNADLVMIYFEQPDGSGHQFTLTSPLQPTDFLDPTSIGTPGNPPGATGQNPARVAAYDQYLKYAYQQANAAVQSIIKAVGLDAQGRPRSNIIVVSDHGMAPFHTAVNLNSLLLAGGLTTAELAGTSVRLQTSGPTASIYINLAGRETNGTKTTAEYQDLQTKIADALSDAYDPNASYNSGGLSNPLFTHVYTRPTGCGQIGFCTSSDIGQDFGDVFALLREGYNFDGTQSPVVLRLGDSGPAGSAPFSLPNFYGAHGHDSSSQNMSAILFAAGPDINTGVTLPSVSNLDVAPTIMEILGVQPAPTVDGQVLTDMLQ